MKRVILHAKPFALANGCSQIKLDTIRLLVSSLTVPEKVQDGYLRWEDSYSPARLERQLVELRALALDALKIQKNLKY